MPWEIYCRKSGNVDNDDAVVSWPGCCQGVEIMNLGSKNIKHKHTAGMFCFLVTLPHMSYSFFCHQNVLSCVNLETFNPYYHFINIHFAFLFRLLMKCSVFPQSYIYHYAERIPFISLISDGLFSSEVFMMKIVTCEIPRNP